MTDKRTHDTANIILQTVWQRFAKKPTLYGENNAIFFYFQYKNKIIFSSIKRNIASVSCNNKSKYEKRTINSQEDSDDLFKCFL